MVREQEHLMEDDPTLCTKIYLCQNPDISHVEAVQKLDILMYEIICRGPEKWLIFTYLINLIPHIQANGFG